MQNYALDKAKERDEQSHGRGTTVHFNVKPQNDYCYSFSYRKGLWGLFDTKSYSV